MKPRSFLIIMFLGIVLIVFAYLVAHTQSISRISPVGQTAQVASSLSNGLVGYWTFDDGTATDSSGNGNNGTINGATPVAGKFGQALSFNGPSQSVVIGNKYDAPGAFTLSAWVNPAAFASSENIMGKLLSAKGYRLDILKSAGSWHAALEIDSNIFNGSTVLQSGTWYLVTATYDGTNATLYVNGSVDASGVSASPTSTTANFQIGNGNTGPYSGILDDVRVYNRALSSGEVSSLFNTSPSVAPSNPVFPVSQTPVALANQQNAPQQEQANTPLVSSGTSIAAASCSESDVETAINQAAAGDTIQIPAGTCTWTTTLNLTTPITLAGAGEDVTTIVDNVTKTQQVGGPNYISPQVFIITANTGGLTRLTNFTLNGGAGPIDPDNSSMIILKGTSQTWRIDHLHVITTRTAGFRVFASSGVFDHNTFDLAPTAYYAIYGFNGSFGSDGATDSYGDSSWAEPAQFGTDRAFFVEDNLFRTSGSMTAAIDGWNGEHITIRYNTFQNTIVTNHGTESPGLARGARAMEIYHNAFTYTGSAYPAPMSFRSGNVLVYDNTATGSGFSMFAHTTEYRDYDPYSIWGQCNGSGPYDENGNGGSSYDSGAAGTNSTNVQDHITLTDSGKDWTPNQWLGYSVNNVTKGLSTTVLSNTANTITMLADPEANPVAGRAVLSWNIGDSYTITRALLCIDQMGRGAGALWDRNNNTKPNPPFLGWPNEIAESSYVWSNTLNGAPAGLISESTHILENRDFFNNYSMPGYTPYVYPHPLVQEEDGVGPTPISLNATTGAPPVYVPQTILPPAIPAQTPVPPTVLPVPLTPLTPQTPLIPTTPATPATPVTPITPAVTSAFSTPLKLGDTSPEVASLQQFLNTHGFYVSLTGIGSPGQETDYFGTLTQDAVIRFQNYYQLDVLTPLSLSRGTGYFGEETMGEVNEVLK